VLKLRERKTREWKGMVTLFGVRPVGKGHVEEERFAYLVGAGLGVLSRRSVNAHTGRPRPNLAFALGLRGHRGYKRPLEGEGAALASDLPASWLESRQGIPA